MREQIAKYREVIRGWQQALNERVMMKVEEGHNKQWFLDLIQKTIDVMNEGDEELPSLSNLGVREKCGCKAEVGDAPQADCPYCNGSGYIERDAEWGDVDVRKLVEGCITPSNYYPDAFTTKSGGRLFVKEEKGKVE